MTSEFLPLPWVSTTNIYEINLRQYTPEGTIAAFSTHLPRLQDMGVEVLWFMPITPISLQNRKGSLGSYYAAADYTSVSPEFGTLDDFRALVSEAHALGMKVIIDWVANHTGWDHSWTRSHPSFYVRDEWGNFKPPFPDWQDVIQLNFNNPEVWHAMIDAMRFWVEICDIDGFRCDMAMLVSKDFWAEARKQLDEVKPLFWYGEFDQWDNPDYAFVFDASYTWRWMHGAAAFYQHHRNMAALDDILMHYSRMLPRHHIRSYFTSNHDENSWNGTEYEKYGEMARALAVFSCTWSGIPLIYSGQEMPNYRRLAFFEKDPIQWNGQYLLHEFYQKLLRLRKTHPALAAHPAVNTIRIGIAHDQEVFAFARILEKATVLVLLNFSAHEQVVHLYDDRIEACFTEIFTQETLNLQQQRQISLTPWGYKVYAQ